MKHAEPVKLRTADIRGTAVDVCVSPTGWFMATLNGHAYRAQTYDELWRALLAASRKASARVEIPFVCCKLSEATVTTGVLTGRHARTRRLLVRWDDARGAMQVDEPYATSDEVFWSRPLTADEIAAWAALRDAYVHAREAYRKWRDRFRIRPGALLDDAQHAGAEALARAEAAAT